MRASPRVDLPTRQSELHGHELRLTWGQLTALRAHLDTQRLSATLDRMARNGLDEAAAAPIGDDR